MKPPPPGAYSYYWPRADPVPLIFSLLIFAASTFDVRLSRPF